MTILKRPTIPTPASTVPANDKAIDAFIKGAPDANSSASDPSGEAMEQISIRMPKALLERATKMAGRQGIPRASYIKRALALQLEQDEK